MFRARSKHLATIIAIMAVALCGHVGAREREAIDPETGLRLPVWLAAFKRDGPITYDPNGYPMGHFQAGRWIRLGLYYYKDKPFATEYANCLGYVKLVQPDARLISDGPSTLRPSGRHAIFTFSGKFFGSDVKMISELLMFPHRDRYIKFRVTYPATQAGVARREIDLFVRAFKLP